MDTLIGYYFALLEYRHNVGCGSENAVYLAVKWLLSRETYDELWGSCAIVRQTHKSRIWWVGHGYLLVIEHSY